tara:strand:- start:6687 stop:7700 length:1014 start_codon:yes stop_codon:yes gene_type:complete
LILGIVLFPSSLGAEEQNAKTSSCDKASKEPWTYSVQSENDFYGGGTDRHYTNGLLFSVLSPDRRCANIIIKTARLFIPDDANYRYNYVLGHTIFTPNDISIRTLQQTERPYAGWLYTGAGVIAITDHSLQRFMVQVGIVGPAALGRFVQENWHDLIGSPDPKGWDNQLRNEPGIVLTYEYQAKPASLVRMQKNKLEILPHVGFSVGNVFTYAAAGATFRFGYDIPEDYPPPRIQPSLPGSTYFNLSDQNSFYVFAGFEGRAVARNIFLDGNSFRNSHEVNKKTFVGDIQFGAVALIRKPWFLPPFRVSYTYVIRSREFVGQTNSDRFGSINIAFQL